MCVALTGLSHEEVVEEDGEGAASQLSWKSDEQQGRGGGGLRSRGEWNPLGSGKVDRGHFPKQSSGVARKIKIRNKFPYRISRSEFLQSHVHLPISVLGQRDR